MSGGLVLGRHWSLDWSWRYGVIGVFADSSGQIVRIYPVPFVRLSWVGRL